MSPAPAAGVVLSVGGALPAVRALVGRFFVERGWQVRERGPALLVAETGSRRRTVLLGALAGRRFHLTAPLELHEVPGGVEVRYRWGAGAGRALGGSLGRARATRSHERTAAALAEALGADGRGVQVRRL